MIYRTYSMFKNFSKTVFESQFFVLVPKILKNFKIDAFNLQSFFTVDINNHAADLSFLRGYSRRKKYL